MRPSDLLERWLAASAAGDSGGAGSRAASRRCATGVRRSRPVPAAEPVSRVRSAKRRSRSSDAELQAAPASRPGWDPRAWTLDQAARVYLLLREHVGRRRNRAAGSIGFAAPPTSANSSRSIAACRCIPTNRVTRCARRRAFARTCGWSSRPWRIAIRIRRSNSNEPAWNQLVLKALFVGSPLRSDRRARRTAQSPRLLACSATTRTSDGRHRGR